MTLGYGGPTGTAPGGLKSFLLLFFKKAALSLTS
jgi:hypothetical protein